MLGNSPPEFNEVHLTQTSLEKAIALTFFKVFLLNASAVVFVIFQLIGEMRKKWMHKNALIDSFCESFSARLLQLLEQ